MERRSFFDRITPYVIGGTIAAVVMGLLVNSRIIPETKEVQRGYVNPRDIKIELEDSDKNGKKETILRYKEKPYSLTLDEQGNPRIQVYEIRPAEVVPKN